MNNEKGFSLIELLISITIFAIALLGLQVLQILAVKQVSGGDMLNGANAALISLLEELNSYTVEELTTTDSGDSFKFPMQAKGDFGNAISGSPGTGHYETKYDSLGDGDTSNDIYHLEWDIKPNDPGSPEYVTIDAKVKWLEKIGMGKLPTGADPEGNRELRGVTVIR